jgi:hypothetical protein
MSFRISRSFGFLAIAVLTPAPAVGQTEPAKTKAVTRVWTPPLTRDGHPDLQGNWVNRLATPLERPEQLKGRQFLTDAEVTELKARAARIFQVGAGADAPAGDDVFLAALENREQYRRSAATGNADNMLEREFDNRTSLIVDPPDGRIPPYTPEGRQRVAAAAAATGSRNAPEGPEDLTNIQRCITFGVPMPRPGAQTAYYQIVQTPGYVVVVVEWIHDARIIPLDGRPHLPPGIRTWNGDSVGHWESGTLVVDTTNFSPKSYFMGSAENLHLEERFTRVAADEIRYQIAVRDPTTWTRPWTAVIRLRQTRDRIYEVACHEGNLPIMETMLSGALASEKTVEQTPRNKHQ